MRTSSQTNDPSHRVLGFGSTWLKAFHGGAYTLRIKMLLRWDYNSWLNNDCGRNRQSSSSQQNTIFPSKPKPLWSNQRSIQSSASARDSIYFHSVASICSTSQARSRCNSHDRGCPPFVLSLVSKGKKWFIRWCGMSMRRDSSPFVIGASLAKRRNGRYVWLGSNMNVLLLYRKL